MLNPEANVPLNKSEMKTAQDTSMTIEKETYQTTGLPNLDEAKMRVRNVDVFYGEKQAIFDVNIDIGKNEVISMIGPSGCGKSTFLRCLNRMNDTIDICRVSGSLLLDNEDIYDRKIDVVELRARVGMVFQKPNPFPKSIYENVAYGARIHGLTDNKVELDELVEKSLVRCGLWKEVKDRLSEPATGLSGGQQQRVIIARALCSKPDLLVFDEPLNGVDFETKLSIYDLLLNLNKNKDVTILFVSHEVEHIVGHCDHVLCLNRTMHEGCHPLDFAKGVVSACSVPDKTLQTAQTVPIHHHHSADSSCSS